MTRLQIVEMTSETDRRLLANETGVAPVSEKHAKRFAELKRLRTMLEADRLEYQRYIKRR